MNKTFTTLIRHFIAFSAIAQQESRPNLSYPHLIIFSDGSIQFVRSLNQTQDFKNLSCAIDYFKVEPIALPLNRLENAIQSFLRSPGEVYLRFYPLGFYWEYGQSGIGGLESGETVEQLQKTINLYQKIPVSV
jgi:hypothetical protein